jgi:hypothetical protein
MLLQMWLQPSLAGNNHPIRSAAEDAVLLVGVVRPCGLTCMGIATMMQRQRTRRRKRRNWKRMILATPVLVAGVGEGWEAEVGLRGGEGLSRPLDGRETWMLEQQQDHDGEETYRDLLSPRRCLRSTVLVTAAKRGNRGIVAALQNRALRPPRSARLIDRNPLVRCRHPRVLVAL